MALDFVPIFAKVALLSFSPVACIVKLAVSLKHVQFVTSKFNNMQGLLLVPQQQAIFHTCIYLSRKCEKFANLDTQAGGEMSYGSCVHVLAKRESDPLLWPLGKQFYKFRMRAAMRFARSRKLYNLDATITDALPALGRLARDGEWKTGGNANIFHNLTPAGRGDAAGG